MRAIILLALFMFSARLLSADSYAKKSFEAHAISEDQAPVIDGLLEDEIWLQAEWQNDFVQYRPIEGAQPSQQTAVVLIYDQYNIYVAIRAWDTAPDSIVRRMTRRDQIEGDYVGVQFDSYHDQRTAFSFFVSAAGVKLDMFISNNGENRDLNYNPIWYVKTRIDSEGWTAEMRIPLNQLRFNPENSKTWGFQVERLIHRNEETIQWQPISRNASGYVNNLGTLTGLNNLNPGRTIDITPYTLSSAQSLPAGAANPFARENRYDLKAGVDGKFGITSNLTLDFTVNPDFGQVEADPSQVNLTAFETFFPEQRPFFVEGRELFDFKLSFGDGDMGTENLFYSRRIGRKPQYQPSLQADQYANTPEFTPIASAVKLTGRTQNGLSIGLLNSITPRVYAEIDTDAERSSFLVEPFTNYLAGNVTQEFNNGNTVVGILGTAVNRNLSEDHLGFLHNSAYSGGFNLTHFFSNRSYMLRSAGYASHVKGSKDAILRTQRAPAHYFQRPDATHLQLDTNRTSLTGTGGNIQIWKNSGKLRAAAAVVYKSPELELNDIGYLRTTDEIFQVLWAGYRITEPFSIFRQMNLGINQWAGLDFNGERKTLGGNLNWWAQFTNYWQFSQGVNYNHESISSSLLRGGPSIILPSSINSWMNISTGSQRKLQFSANYFFMKSFDEHINNNNLSLSATYRPHNALLIRLSPGYMLYTNELQYVNTVQGSNSSQYYIMGSLQQKVISMSLRINYTITPELSLQFWGQPFIASGKYIDFKKITDPRASLFTERFYTFSPEEILCDPGQNQYIVTESGSSEISYEFQNPNFNVKEFLSNLVVRWEYRPGSVLFLVWSQTRDHYDPLGQFDLSDNMNTLFTGKPHNIFMLKFSYRIGV